MGKPGGKGRGKGPPLPGPPPAADGKGVGKGKKPLLSEDERKEALLKAMTAIPKTSVALQAAVNRSGLEADDEVRKIAEEEIERRQQKEREANERAEQRMNAKREQAENAAQILAWSSTQMVTDLRPWLWLGLADSVNNVAELQVKTGGITHILNVSQRDLSVQFPTSGADGLICQNICWDDPPTKSGFEAKLQECIAFIHKTHAGSEQNRILVCSKENSLSCSFSVVLAYFVQHEGKSLREVWQEAREKRPGTQATKELIQMLCDFECQAGVAAAPTLDVEKMDGDGKTFFRDRSSQQGDSWIVCCPHCEAYFTVTIDDVNCKIFRHGVLKETGLQISPHSAKETVEQLLAEGQIYGCGQPVRFDPNKWWAPEEVVTKEDWI